MRKICEIRLNISTDFWNIIENNPLFFENSVNMSEDLKFHL